ncbi:hypothetical protein AALP_AAs60151U000100, partial [Arabis alpina]
LCGMSLYCFDFTSSSFIILMSWLAKVEFPLSASSQRQSSHS